MSSRRIARSPSLISDQERGYFELPLLEREREFSKLLQSVTQSKPALVCGSPGFGKTRLLFELQHELTAAGESVLYVPFKQSLHAFLTGMAGGLSLKCQSDSSMTVRGILWKELESEPKIVLSTILQNQAFLLSFL